MYTPGSGGYGNPFKRNKFKVLEDVIEKKVSIEKAKELYGGVKIVKSGHDFILVNNHD